MYDGDKSALVDPCGCLGSGAVDEARDLIARGINIDEQNDYNTTALMKAAQYNRLEIVQALIRAGAALNLQDENGYTALMYAAALSSTCRTTKAGPPCRSPGARATPSSPPYWRRPRRRGRWVKRASANEKGRTALMVSEDRPPRGGAIAAILLEAGVPGVQA